jgi:hypothetical protein
MRRSQPVAFFFAPFGIGRRRAKMLALAVALASCLFRSSGTRADEIVDLATAVKTLTTQVTNATPATMGNSGVSAALSTLVTTIQAKTPCVAPLQAADCHLRDLDTLVASWSTSTPLSQDSLTKLFGEIKSLLETKFTIDDPLKANSLHLQFTLVADAINKLPADDAGIGSSDAKSLVADAAASLDSLISRSKSNPEIDKIAEYSALATVLGTINTIAPKSTGIDVDGAWYGDLSVINGLLKRRLLKPYTWGSRFCSATESVRAFCEGQQACFEPTSQDSKAPATMMTNYANGALGTTATSVPGMLCGYDPTPVADASLTGLVVAFRCSELTQAEWKGQPKEQAQRARFATTVNGETFVILHPGVAGQIRCALPPPAGGLAQ